MRKRFFGLRLSPLPYALCSVALGFLGAMLSRLLFARW